jgi:hyperosmotically inducible protein
MKNNIMIIPALLLSFQTFAGNSADNSKVNVRDRSEKEMTADQQGSETKDMSITRRIRNEIMKEKNLSTYAQNIKIITLDGKVTLKGPVRYESEETNLLNHARNVAGASNVTSEIAIAPE